MRTLIAVLGCLLVGGPAVAAEAVPVVSASATAVPVAAAVDAAPTAHTVCRLRDARITEASGIAIGVASPGVVYVNDDSGDTNRFFALDARTCRTVATITVRGARNVDWEDLAVARDAAGVPSVWLGDIGDNAAERAYVTVYRVAEPRLDAGSGGTRTVDVAQTWRLRYPAGPTDAESLAVAPGGAAYVVTKSLFGASTVYRLPARPDGGVQRLQHAADVALTPVGTSRLGVAGALLATGAAFSADGTRFAIRTYSGAFVWAVRDDDLAAALRASPATLALPAQQQGEGIAFAGSRLLLDSEGAGTAILSVPAPVLAGAPVAASTSATGSGSGSTSAATTLSAAATSPAGGSGLVSPSGSGSSSEKGGYGSGGSWIPGLVIFGLAIVGSLLWWNGQRSRPARGRDR